MNDTLEKRMAVLEKRMDNMETKLEKRLEWIQSDINRIPDAAWRWWHYCI